MAQNIVYLDDCSICARKECVFLLLFGSVMQVSQPGQAVYLFCYLEILKSPNTVVDLFTSPFSAAGFCFMCFEAFV